MTSNLRNLYAIFIGILFSLNVFNLESQTYSFESQPEFDHISVDHGLSQSVISSIVQDHQGFIWIGTLDGLNRYDGYDFKIFKHNPNDSTSISSDNIRSQLVTKDGTLWIGTGDGKINKYNSITNTFTSFSLKSEKGPINIAATLSEHSSGIIWIGTNLGLFSFDPENRSFEEYNFTDVDNKKHYLVTSILEDEKGNLFVGNQNPLGGLFYIDFKRNINYHFYEPSEINDLTESLGVNVIKKSKNGACLVGTNKGLYILKQSEWQSKTERNSNLNYSFYNSTERVTDLVQIHRIEVDQEGDIWIGSFNYSGLQVIDYEDKSLTFYDIQGRSQQRFSHLYVVASFIDFSGNIWLGTNGAGVFKYAKNNNKFGNIHQNSNSNFKINSKSIRGILEDSKNRLWVAGYGGLDVLDMETGESRFIGIWGPGKPSDVHYVPTWFVYEDPIEGEDIYWIGTEGDGLYRYNYKNNILDEYYYPIISKQLEYKKYQRKTHSNSPYRLLRDRDHQLWMTSSTGLEKFNASTRSFEKVVMPEGICNMIPSIIVEPSNSSDYLWISTWECGLLLYNKRTGIYDHILPKPNDPNSLSSRTIYTISEDENQNLWIGTNNGISVLNLKNVDYSSPNSIANLKFKKYSMNDGLANNHIYGILEGNNGEVWVSSNKGLASLDKETGFIKNFDVDDGLQGLEFNRHAYAKGKDGKLYFGGMNGVNFFYPDQMGMNNNIPKIVFTDFKVLNKPFDLKDEKGGIINISDAESIELTHNQNIISFEFAALEFTEPNKNQYAYKLEEFNEDWINIGNKREANYTNLDPGVYTFHVKASNNDNIWNEEGISIKLIINPPWWLTIWAIIIWICVMIIGVYYTYKILSYRVKIIERLKMRDQQVEKLKELDEFKTNFFSNISHEFRTPLTLILNPIKSMLVKAEKKEDKQEINMVLRNTNRLLQLVNQILDLSKLESGEMKRVTKTGDLVECVKRLVSSFDSLADNYSITFQKHFSVNKLVTDFNDDHIEKIINNILSNAFKFTPKGGKVKFLFELLTEEDVVLEHEISSDVNISKWKIVIIDTGIGISKETLPKIFDRFYQADISSSRNYEGTGIGLALVKELTEFYGGKLNINSESDWGTEVTIIFPIKEVYSVKWDDSEPQIMTEAIKMTETESGLNLKKEEWTIDSSKSDIDGKNIILVVEDNKDLRQYIKSIIQTDFVVLEAENGHEGWEMAINQIPDLIISDVMMPILNGFEFAEKLKKDQRTSHIPIILLTAISSIENKLSGLKIGVDEYLTKPFDKDELIIRIQNLIEIRSTLQNYYLSGNFTSRNPRLPEMESLFLKKAKQVVEENMDSEQFSVDDLSTELGLNRAQFHRKVKAITNHSTTHFIRSIRLEKAKELLSNENFNVTEVAYMVGFSSQSYFTKSFQKHFGFPPSTLSKNN